MEQRLQALEAHSTPNNTAQLIESAITAAVSQIGARLEIILTQQTQLSTQLLNNLNDRRGGSVMAIHQPEAQRSHTQDRSLNPLMLPIPCLSTPSSPPPTPPSSFPSTHHNWLSTSQIYATLQARSNSPLLPMPLVIESNVMSKSTLTMLQEVLVKPNIAGSDHVLGVIFAGNRHWQPIVISPTTCSITLWDVSGPLQLSSTTALTHALPGWLVAANTIPPYPDGDCGVATVEILLAASRGQSWANIPFANLNNHRATIECSPISSTISITHQHIGGSVTSTSMHSPIQVTTSSPSAPTPSIHSPTSTLSRSHHTSTATTSSNPATNPPTRTQQWTNAVARQDEYYQSHSYTGTLDGSDIRMATININGLSDAKLPFLAWLFIKFELDFLAIQDTRIAQSNWHNTKTAATHIFPPNTMFLHSPPKMVGTGPTSLIGGVAIMVSSRCCSSPNYRSDPLKCGAICAFSFATTLGRLLIISTYFPNRAPDLNGSLWTKIAQSMPPSATSTPLQHLMAVADQWSTLEEAQAGTFLLGDLNASIGSTTTGGCHNINQ